MPPFHPPLKNDGPACRVCGCTEHNACVTDDRLPRVPRPRSWQPGLVTCSWVKTTRADTGPLCSACAGTAADLVETIGRARRLLAHGKTRIVSRAKDILAAAENRHRRQKKEVDAAG